MGQRCLGRLLHEIVVLDPKGKGVHADRNYEHHDCEFELGIGRYPSHEKLSDVHNRLAQQVLYCEEHGLHSNHDAVPDDELNEPREVVDSKSTWRLHDFVASFSHLKRQHLGLRINDSFAVHY